MPGAPVVSLSADVQPIINSQCTNCHTNGGSRGGLSLDAGNTFNNLVNQPNNCGNLDLIVPDQPSSSHFVRKVQRTNITCGSAMPPASPLTSAQVDTIVDWVCQGAQNN